MTDRPSGEGRVEVICGSMFSGKTEELLRRLRRAQIARQKVQVFKPALDTRYGEGEVTSHNGLGFEALRVERPTQILEALQSDTTVVAIDEVQFFGEAIGHVCQTLAERGVRVIVTGLDLDFRGEPFGPVPLVMAQAERVDKLHAICVVCGDDASRSQRLINGKPARYDDPVILVGATEVYEARCRTHHEVVARPVREERAEGPPP